MLVHAVLEVHDLVVSKVSSEYEHILLHTAEKPVVTGATGDYIKPTTSDEIVVAQIARDQVVSTVSPTIDVPLAGEKKMLEGTGELKAGR